MAGEERTIFTVTFGPADDIALQTRLIRATSKARAVRHVAHEVLGIQAERASQEDLVSMLGEGRKVEDAKEGE